MAHLPAFCRALCHLYDNDGGKLRWTLDSVTLENLCEQYTKGQVNILVCVADCQQISVEVWN